MDENLAWKIVYAAVAFCLVIMGITYFLISPRESAFFTDDKMEKIAEFKATRVAGRKEGKKTWVFHAEDGWTDRNREVTYINKVSEGSIYMDGRLVVTGLSAPRAKTYARSDIVEVFGYPIHAYLELGRMSGKKGPDRSEWTRMVANYLKYIPKRKCSEISERVELHKHDSSIYAEDIKVDHESKIAHITKNVSLVRKDGTLKADNMRYLGANEELEAHESVYMRIKEGDLHTKLKTNHAYFFTETSRDMTLEGSIEVAQGKKLAVAGEGVYSQTKNELLMKKDVKAVFEKARAILKEESVENLKSSEAKDILKEKTVLTSDELVFSTRTGDARASGSVFVSQKGRDAKADFALYDDKQEIITLSGNVFMKKEDEWVSAKKVTVSVKDETFEAEGAVEAKFQL